MSLGAPLRGGGGHLGDERPLCRHRGRRAGECRACRSGRTPREVGEKNRNALGFRLLVVPLQVHMDSHLLMVICLQGLFSTRIMPYVFDIFLQLSAFVSNKLRVGGWGVWGGAWGVWGWVGAIGASLGAHWALWGLLKISRELLGSFRGWFVGACGSSWMLRGWPWGLLAASWALLDVIYGARGVFLGPSGCSSCVVMAQSGEFQQTLEHSRNTHL